MRENSGMTDAALMEYLNALRYATRGTYLGWELDKFSEARNAVMRLMDDRDRLTAEVLRLQDAVMESDARGAALRDRFTALADEFSAECTKVVMGGEGAYTDGRAMSFTIAAQRVRAALSPATSTGSEVGK